MSKKESKELEVSKNNLPSISIDFPVGIEHNFSASDIAFPKLWLLQPMSQAVLEGKARPGDFWHTAEEKVLPKELKIVPVLYKKVCFVTSKPAGKNEKFKLVDMFEVKTQEQEKLAWNEIVDGNEIKREYAMVFFVLIEGYDMPIMLTLKSTSYNVGKKIATQMYVINKMKQSIYYPSVTTFLLTSKIEKNDEGTYAVFNARPIDITSEERQKECLNWYNILKDYALTNSIAEGPVNKEEQDNF